MLVSQAAQDRAWWIYLADGATVLQLGERTRRTHTLDGEVSVVAVTPDSLSFLLLCPQTKASESFIETDDSVSLIPGKGCKRK